MYYYPEVAAEACRGAGFRLQAAFPIIEMPNVYAKDAGECFTKGLELHDRFRHDPLITTCFGPHAAYTVSRDNLERVAMLADEVDIGVQTHLHETAAEVAMANRKVGTTWIRLLDGVGLLNENLQAVHMTAVTEAEVALIAERGVRVIHCPHSNMKLASGVCPVPGFVTAGTTVGLGTDGAASNNALDMFAEARLAALLAKTRRRMPRRCRRRMSWSWRPWEAPGHWASMSASAASRWASVRTWSPSTSSIRPCSRCTTFTPNWCTALPARG